MRYPFIRDHEHLYPVDLLCEVLQVTRSSYYAWRGNPPSTSSPP